VRIFLSFLVLVLGLFLSGCGSSTDAPSPQGTGGGGVGGSGGSGGSTELARCTDKDFEPLVLEEEALKKEGLVFHPYSIESAAKPTKVDASTAWILHDFAKDLGIQVEAERRLQAFTRFVEVSDKITRSCTLWDRNDQHNRVKNTTDVAGRRAYFLAENIFAAQFIETEVRLRKAGLFLLTGDVLESPPGADEMLPVGPFSWNVSAFKNKNTDDAANARVEILADFRKLLNVAQEQPYKAMVLREHAELLGFLSSTTVEKSQLTLDLIINLSKNSLQMRLQKQLAYLEANGIAPIKGADGKYSISWESFRTVQARRSLESPDYKVNMRGLRQVLYSLRNVLGRLETLFEEIGDIETAMDKKALGSWSSNTKMWLDKQ